MSTTPEQVRALAEARIRSALHDMLEELKDVHQLKVTGVKFRLHMGEFVNRVTDEPGFKIDLDFRLVAEER